MPEFHPEADLLERFIRGELDTGESREVVRHLVAGCARCIAETRRLWSRGPSPQGYDAVFARLLDRYGAPLERLAAERRAAPELLDELLRQTAARRVALVCGDGRFRSLPLCELLIDRVRDAGPGQPPVETPEVPETPAIIEAAELALAVAERLDERSDEGLGATLVRSAQTRAWAWLGNARRLAADLPGARRALDTAELLLEQAAAGPVDPLEEAEVLALAAQLHAEQRQPRHLDEAAARFDRAATLYRAAGERHLLGRLLIQKGMALGKEALRQSALGRSVFGQPGWGLTAAAALAEGLGLAGASLGRPLRARTLSGLVTMLLEAGRPEETLEPLRELRRIHEEEAGDGLALVRLRRLEGKADEALGRFDAAEAALMEARAGFLRARMGPEAAFVSVELAVVYARRGRALEMRRLSDDMSPVYLSKDVSRDVVSALIVFQRLAECEPGNLAFLIEVAKFLGGSARLGRSLRPLQWVS